MAISRCTGASRAAAAHSARAVDANPLLVWIVGSRAATALPRSRHPMVSIKSPSEKSAQSADLRSQIAPSQAASQSKEVTDVEYRSRAVWPLRSPVGGCGLHPGSEHGLHPGARPVLRAPGRQGADVQPRVLRS